MTSLILDNWLVLRLRFEYGRQAQRDATASKGKGDVGPSLPRQREVRGQVLPPWPHQLVLPTPSLSWELGLPGQEVRSACRKPQEELRLQPTPPPPPWGPGDLGDT